MLNKIEALEFYKQARHNNYIWSTQDFGYEHDREVAFVNWCDFIISKIEKIPFDEFNFSNFREQYGTFDYPYPTEEYE